MTKNSGGKAFRKGKTGHGGAFRREILFKECGQEYALVTKMLGSGHVECKCYDDVVRLGNIRGKMRRRVWIAVGDVVLCGLREYQDEKVDIIHKYTPDEVHNLRSMGEIPSEDSVSTNNAATTTTTLDDVPINIELI